MACLRQEHPGQEGSRTSGRANAASHTRVPGRETTGARDGLSGTPRAPWRAGGPRWFRPVVCPSGLSPARPAGGAAGLLPRAGGRRGRLSPRAKKARCRSAWGAGLADGPEGEPHAREEGVPGVCGQRGVGSGVGGHGPVAQRRRVDVRVEARREGRVGRLRHGPRDHQLQQAAGTSRGSVRHPEGGLRLARSLAWCQGGAGERPGHTALTRHPEAPDGGADHAGSQRGKQNRGMEAD